VRDHPPARLASQAPTLVQQQLTVAVPVPVQVPVPARAPALAT
jgi:hypothetical protein